MDLAAPRRALRWVSEGGAAVVDFGGEAAVLQGERAHRRWRLLHTNGLGSSSSVVRCRHVLFFLFLVDINLCHKGINGIFVLS